MRLLDKPMILIWLIGAAVVLFIVDVVFYVPKTTKAVVIDKHYESGHNRIGTGIGYVNGNSAIVTTYENEPEKFLLMVEINGNEIVTAETTSYLYYHKQNGSIATCQINHGLLTGFIWGYQIIN